MATTFITRSIEDTDEEIKVEEERSANFRMKLDEFSFRSPETSPARRSVTRSSQKSGDPTPSPGSQKAVVETSAAKSSRRKRTVVPDEEDSSVKAKKKRGYAPPEAYAHLNYLADCLGVCLDVLFCGINPGVHSATVGHHFAHPGNRFYKMLHGSGFTDRLMPPEEDSTLPALYNIGITDIVDRPSSCEDELATEEMIDGTPILLQKVAKYKPRFVCFVGKGMGQKVEKGFRREIGKSKSAVELGRTARRQRQKGSSSTKHSTNRSNSNLDNGIGLRPFKVTHDDPDSPVRETLFFVSYSSSGLATSMNLQGKIDLLKELRALVEKHKSGTLDTSSLEEVPVALKVGQ